VNGGAGHSSFDGGIGAAHNRLNQLQPLQTRVPFLADDDVVVHGNTERLRHGNNLLRHLDIGAARCGIATWMIVQDAL
jgi:hypothetical protein